MVVLILGWVIFFWLIVGSVQYLLCLAVPRLRRYALSAALWWAVWGPCSVALMMLAGLAFVVQAFMTQEGAASHLHLPNLPVVLGWGYVILGAAGTAAVATSVAWLHQAVARRLTFALFRLYATAVSAGIGSVFGWCFGLWMLPREMRYGWAVWGTVMLALIVGFGLAAYREPRALRGEPPTTFPWVSREEFDGI